MSFSSSRQILKAELEARKARNARYSLRAFAAHLKISSGRLHEILSGRYYLSLKTAHKIAHELKFDTEKKTYFLRLVENEIYLRKALRGGSGNSSIRLLAEEEFTLIHEWEYFATMALVETASFRSEIPWVAKKLLISESRANSVIEYLLSQGLLYRDEYGVLKNNYSSMSTITDYPSEIIRKATVECIHQSLINIGKIDIMMRDVSSLTLPVDVEKIPEVKSLIREFKNNVTALMSRNKTTEVYNLNIQFMPITELGI